jgi:uncharacterized protein DUF397
MRTLHWRKSPYSGDGSNCVEIAATPTAIHIRDSKNPTGPCLALSLTTWADFVIHTAEQTNGEARVRDPAPDSPAVPPPGGHA